MFVVMWNDVMQGNQYPTALYTGKEVCCTHVGLRAYNLTGDRVGCLLEVTPYQARAAYQLNGRDLGVAFELERRAVLWRPVISASGG